MEDSLNFIYLIDILGTFAFAISGAFRAVKYELDILGVIVLAVATGVGGGIMRDCLLGSFPPVALLDQSYILVCILGALLVFFMAPKIAKRWHYLLIADAIGLSVFAVIGATKAEAVHAMPLTVIMMAMITATGGGVIRDILVKEIPAILKTDFYATVAFLGGALYLSLGYLDITHNTQITLTIIITLAARLLGMKYKINLPKVKSLPASPSQIAKQRRRQHYHLKKEKPNKTTITFK